MEAEHTDRRTAYRPQRTRLRRDRPPLALQERDRAILTSVWENRFLTRPLLAELFPPAGGNPESDHTRMARRLQSLFHHGYLDRIASPDTKALVYALGSRGAQELVRSREAVERVDWSEKNRKVRALFVEHALMVARLRVALTVALRRLPSIELERFERDNRTLHASWTLKRGWSSPGERRVLRPDGFFVLRDHEAPEGRQRRAYAVETDRSTMTRRRLLEKLASYAELYASGEAAFGVPRFRVLLITKSVLRADGILELAARELPAEFQPLILVAHEGAYRDHLPNVLAAICRTSDTPASPRALIPSPLPLYIAPERTTDPDHGGRDPRGANRG